MAGVQCASSFIWCLCIFIVFLFDVHRNIHHCMFKRPSMMYTLLVLLLDLKVLLCLYFSTFYLCSRLIEPKAVVFECGPNCKCGATCVNRTSQRGLKYRLEVL